MKLAGGVVFLDVAVASLATMLHESVDRFTRQTDIALLAGADVVLRLQRSELPLGFVLEVVFVFVIFILFVVLGLGDVVPIVVFIFFLIRANPAVVVFVFLFIVVVVVAGVVELTLEKLRNNYSF